MTYDASSRKDIRAAEKLATHAESQRITFLCAAMDTIPGRAWFYNLLSSCHIFADPFTGIALAEAYSKGERNVGLGIYADIVQYCPDQFVQMIKEANHARDNDRDSRTSASNPTRRSPAERAWSQEPNGRAAEPTDPPEFDPFDDLDHGDTAQ